MPGTVFERSYRIARRIAVAVIGGTVLLTGVVMIVTPGPAIVVIPLGLGILSLEFAWARRWLARIRARWPEKPGGEKERGSHDPKKTAET